MAGQPTGSTTMTGGVAGAAGAVFRVAVGGAAEAGA